MSKIYNVTFKYSETTYCSNIAKAEAEADVMAHYSKYTDVTITEATESDLREAERKGKPVIECEHVEEQEETATTCDEITRVYLNTWYHYNAGCIGFGWMTTDEAREFMEAHEGQTEFEEWFIADVDNYCGIDTDGLNYRNVNDFLDEIDTLEEMDEDERRVVEAIAECRGCDIAEALENVDSYSVYSDIEEYYDFMDELIDEELGRASEWVSRYFDYEAYHRDCDFDCYEASNGIVLVA